MARCQRPGRFAGRESPVTRGNREGREEEKEWDREREREQRAEEKERV